MGKLSSLYPDSRAVEAALNRANKAEHDVSVLFNDVSILSDGVSSLNTRVTVLEGVLDEKADAADLVELEKEVGTKADNLTLVNTTANLQAQIDEIITPVTQDAEVQNARVGADGTSYQTLKARLDAENSELKEDLSLLSDCLGFESETVSPNIFNKSDDDVLVGKYIGDDGNVVTNANYCESGFIPFEYGATYRFIDSGSFITTSRLVAFYDSDKNFIKTSSEATPMTITQGSTTQGYAYFRYAIKLPELNSLMITKNDTTLYTEYQPYGTIGGTCEIKDRVDFVYNEIKDRVDFVYNELGYHEEYVSPNIFDKNDNDVIRGGYIGTDGTVVTDSAFASTGFIPCVTGDKFRVIINGDWYTSSSNITAFYDSNKNFVRTRTVTYDPLIINDSDVAYVRLVFRVGYIDNLMVIKNDDTLYEYIPYGVTPQTFEVVDKVLNNIPIHWNDKQCICMGDSIMWYDGQLFPNTQTIAYGYPSYLRDKLGLFVNNEGVSGACIASHPERQYEDNVVTVDSINFANYQLAVLEAGVNDYIASSPLGSITSGNYDKETFKGAYQYIIEKILADNPTIQIVMFLPHKITYRTIPNEQDLVLIDYVHAIEEIAEYYSIPLVDLYRKCGFNSKNIATQYTIDGLHQNNEGYKRTNEVLLDVVKGLGGLSI